MSSNAAVDLMVELSGDRVLRTTLEQLATKETRRAARKAITSGMAIMQRALRAAAPPATTPGHDSKSLRQSIRSRHMRNRQTGLVEAKVGIGVGKRKYSAAKGNQEKAPHLHLLALGTQDRYTGARSWKRRKGKRLVTILTGNQRMYRGRMDGDSFIPRTANALQRAVAMHMADVFVEEIERAAERLSHVAGI